MAVMRPFGDIRTQMDRMLSELVEEMNLPAATPSGQLQGWVPAIEVSETDNEYCVRAEVPGIKPENINVEVSGNTLLLSGETREEHQEEKRNVHRSEFCYGQFMRRIPLPGYVDGGKASAEFENGILTLRMPLREEQKRQKIEVKSGNGKR